MIKYKRELESLATSQPSTARLLLKHKPGSFIRAIVDATWTHAGGKIEANSIGIEHCAIGATCTTTNCFAWSKSRGTATKTIDTKRR